jgi:hypothetical protein
MYRHNFMPLGSIHQVAMVVGVFIPAMRAFKFRAFSQVGLLRQEIALRALIRDHRVRKFIVAVVAFQDPFGHKDQPYPLRNLLKIRKNIYLSLVLLGRYRTKRTGEK